MLSGWPGLNNNSAEYLEKEQWAKKEELPPREFRENLNLEGCRFKVGKFTMEELDAIIHKFKHNKTLRSPLFCTQ